VDALTELARDLAVEVSQHVRPPHFMSTGVLQEALRKTIYNVLRDSDLFNEQAAAQIAVDIMQLARANREFYIRRREPRG
jgi:hypothetical protein